MEFKDGQLSVCVSNSILDGVNRAESTKIGLRTCEKIMSLLGGGFSVCKDKEHFAVQFSLPASPGAPEESEP